MERLNRIMSHLGEEELVDVKQQQQLVSQGVSNEESKDPSNTLSWANRLRWSGWGYHDTAFDINDKGEAYLKGTRYLFSGKTLPHLRPWMEENAGLDIDNASPAQDDCPVPPPQQNEGFLAEIKDQYAAISTTDKERLFHAHGHTTQELFKLRWGEFKRVPDVVIWPGSNEHVEAIVKAAVTHNCVIIPYGGGTNVTQALLPPEDEKRFIISLDMHAMGRIKWVDRVSMTACIEAGAVGKELEARLDDLGLVLGHEPDSLEFSTLGGWISKPPF